MVTQNYLPFLLLWGTDKWDSGNYSYLCKLMKNLWSEILVPAVIAGLTVIGTVGVESARTVRPETRVRLLREVRLDTLRRDTVPPDTGKKAVPVKKDTVLKNLSDDEFDFFGVTVQDADTTPRVFARDTMKVPDSLRATDPFL